MHKLYPAFSITAALALTTCLATGTAHAADEENGRQLVESHSCAACHGTKLNNPINAEYPRLAGQHADYLVWAMRQYQMGSSNPMLGRNNAIMHAQVQTLSVNDMKDIAAYLESLPGDLVFKK